LKLYSYKKLDHVGVTDPRPDRNRDHRRRPPLASATTVAVSVAASTAPVIRMRVPVANSMSIVPGIIEQFPNHMHAGNPTHPA
jgi:hypothetical protein